jgi:plastocyanin domain-containing protein
MTRKLVLAVALTALFTGCKKKAKSEAPPAPSVAPPGASTAPATAGAPIAITVTPDGFEPSHITVKQGVETQLVFTRKTEETCAKDVIISVDDTQQIHKDLPMDTAVAVSVTFPKAGELSYACGMNMVTGVITVQ